MQFVLPFVKPVIHSQDSGNLPPPPPTEETEQRDETAMEEDVSHKIFPST